MERQERQELIARLRRDGQRIAQHFGLPYNAIVAENPRVKSHYGICYSNGLIKIRLNHAKTGGALKYSSLIDTLCHELAHLKHFNHGPEFKAFFFELLGWARKAGIYRPGPRRASNRFAPGLTSRQRDAVARYAEPPRRNGVPIFIEPTSKTPQVLPWEMAVDDGPAPRPASRVAPTPPITSPPATERQLSLLAPSQRGSKTAGLPPPTVRRKPQQLSLF